MYNRKPFGGPPTVKPTERDHSGGRFLERKELNTLHQHIQAAKTQSNQENINNILSVLILMKVIGYLDVIESLEVILSPKYQWE